MIGLGYTTKLIEIYRSVEFPEEFSKEGEKGYIERFHGYENWDKLSFQDRIIWRKGMFVHEKKTNPVFNNYLEYFQEIISFTDFIMDFLEKTEPILNNNEIFRGDDDLIHLFRLHAFLYCELYSILKNEDIKKIKHTLHPDLISPILYHITQTVYYSKYNLPELDNINEKVRELCIKGSIE